MPLSAHVRPSFGFQLWFPTPKHETGLVCSSFGAAQVAMEGQGGFGKRRIISPVLVCPRAHLNTEDRDGEPIVLI